MALRTCTVSFTGASGVRHSVEVTARIHLRGRSSRSALKSDGWADAIAPGTELEVQVREPATCHRLTVLQLRPGAMASRLAPTRHWRSDGWSNCSL